jgi:hypothetical protein
VQQNSDVASVVGVQYVAGRKRMLQRKHEESRYERKGKHKSPFCIPWSLLGTAHLDQSFFNKKLTSSLLHRASLTVQANQATT